MQSGALRLFRFAGIQVYLHFTWFIVAAYQLSLRAHQYQSPAFALFEYIALFVIVLMHEFGHALACRQVGGYADHIILWPLGGIAFVNPPQRAGAMLWSIAAGPLVNVALAPILELLVALAQHSSWVSQMPDALRLLVAIRFINYGLLIFNLLPIYPLDGGQILRALLWFPFGEIRSLQIASVIGLVGGALLALVALLWQSLWLGILAFFLLSRAVAGWQYAKALTKARATPPPLDPLARMPHEPR